MKRLTFEQFLSVLPPLGYKTVAREITEDCKVYVYPKLDLNNHTTVERTHYLQLEHPDEDQPDFFFGIAAHHRMLFGQYSRSLYEFLQFDNEEEWLMHIYTRSLENTTEETKFLLN